MIRSAETGGLGLHRHNLLSAAHGATLEVGAATGLNIRHLPDAVTTLVLIEPDRHMMRQLIRRVARLRPEARVLFAVAEQLPFPEATFDTVILLFALCCVTSQCASLEEIARVLTPGGQLLFIEHVRSDDLAIAARQDRIPFPYSCIGCHPNRDTRAELESSSLTMEWLRTDEVPNAPAIERPMIFGVARKSRPVPRGGCPDCRRQV